MININEALNIIDNLDVTWETKTCPLYESLNYTLAKDIVSHVNVPTFNKSAMDGYALIQEDLGKFTEFKIVGTVYAGEQNNIVLNHGECIKIMTGAKVCKNSDIVIQKELASLGSEDSVTFTIPKTGLNDNIAKIGEDIQVGEVVLKKGELLKPICLAMIKSIGIEEVEVYKKPKICFITIGDEIIQGNQINSDNINSTLEEQAKIFNTNEAYIYTRLIENNLTDVNTYLIDDDPKKLQEIFTKDYDLFITTGAISVGDKDIVRQFVNKENTEVYFDRINIMPGGPACLFKQNNKLVLALAGSPYANFVTFEMLGMNLLSRLTLNENLKPKLVKRVFKSSWDKKIKKPRFVRAYTDDQNAYLKTTNHKASCINQMNECNSFVFMQNKEQIKTDDIVDVYFFGGV